MITHYRIGKIAGPSLIFAGYILMVFGVITIYFTIVSLGLVLFGACLVFTTLGTIIDSEKKSYKSYVELAGLIKIGNEKSFSKEDAIEVRKFKGSHVSYSRSNRTTAAGVSFYNIYLISVSERKKLLIARFETEAEAVEESKNLISIIHSIT